MEKLKSRQEMANLLGISTKTLQRRMKDAGIIVSNGLLTIHDQKSILEIFYKGKSNSKEFLTQQNNVGDRLSDFV